MFYVISEKTQYLRTLHFKQMQEKVSTYERNLVKRSIRYLLIEITIHMCKLKANGNVSVQGHLQSSQYVHSLEIRRRTTLISQQYDRKASVLK